MKFVTFNIRCDHGGDQDGANNFRFRKPLILRTLAEEKPDIICFQEVLPHVADWLRENLSGYTTVGCGRSATLESEQVTVAFRADKYNLMEMHTFWMSPTPYVPGSRYEEQSSCPRVCTEVLLFEKETLKVVRVINIHLDHRGEQARRLGLKKVLEHIDGAKLYPDAAVIMAGDFNDYPDSGIWDSFADHPGYTNATENIGQTYHGYMQSEDKTNIDYIYLRGGLRCDSVRKWEKQENGVWLSDHFPISAELTWQE